MSRHRDHRYDLAWHPIDPSLLGWPESTPPEIVADPVWNEELISHPVETLARLRRVLAHRASTDDSPHT